MNSLSDGLSDRFLGFAVRIIKTENQLCKTYSGRQIYGQLFRAGIYTGANYKEARAGESKADFIHKMHIVLKEMREGQNWTKLIATSNMVSNDENLLDFLRKESQELANITAKSIVTAKLNLAQKTKLK